MIDNIIRTDWKNQSAYMRNKKITHGMVALCASMRQSIWYMTTLYHQSNCRRSRLISMKDTTINCTTTAETCIQFLLNVIIMVMKK